MARTGFRGIDIRQTSGGKLIIRASIKDSTGAAVTAGSPTCRIVELQDDGTLTTLEWNVSGQYTFKASPITATSPTSGGAAAGVVTHQALGVWTCIIPNVSAFQKGGIYIAIISGGTGAFPAQQEREFQWGDADGDLSVSSAKDASSFAVPGDAMGLTAATENFLTVLFGQGTLHMPKQLIVAATGANSSLAGMYSYRGVFTNGYPVYTTDDSNFEIYFTASNWRILDQEAGRYWVCSVGVFPAGTYAANVGSGATGTATVSIYGDITSSLISILAKTNLITPDNINVMNPVAPDGSQITLVVGDDYYYAHARSIDLPSAGYPDMTGATCSLRIISRDTNEVVFSVAGTIVDAQTLRYEISRTNTSLLTPAAIGTYIFASRVTFSDGQIATEKRGQVLVLNG